MSVTTPYRAPSRDGEALILPSLEAAAGLVETNRTRQLGWHVAFCGQPLGLLRQQARQEMLRDAIRYTGAYRAIDNSSEIDAGAAIVMAGHQPTLFHPGVWFKNFAIDAIAKRMTAKRSCPAGAVAINLVIDNDVANSSSIRVPTLDVQSGRILRSTIAYDSAAGGVPYEQNRIRDRTTFDAFDQAVQSALGSLVDRPLIDRLWSHAKRAASRCENVSCALAQARHALEGEIGLQTLELPLSVVCRSEPFAAFAVSIAGDADRFRSIYNSSADAYRRANRIRSSAHPVPNLGVDGDWTEIPFWIYSDHHPQRHGAWVRVRGDRLEIGDRGQHRLTLSLPLSGRSPSELLAQCGGGFKLRPRALATTMYARVFLSDLFIHGIGGAKYDELGDDITRRYFGIEPPELMVVTATVHLPLRRPGDERVGDRNHEGFPATVAETRSELRRTRFAPETFADRFALSAELCRAKRELIAQQLIAQRGSASDRKRWHDQITAINRALADELVDYRQWLQQRLPEVRQAAATSSLLSSREHPFCLFPLERLTDAFGRLLR